MSDNNKTELSSVRLSIVMEWENTRLHGTPRAEILLDRLVRQWQMIVAGDYPANLSPEGEMYLERLEDRAQLIIASGEVPGPILNGELEHQLNECFDFVIEVVEGLEYYPLKNYGAERADGDLIFFVDSDVLPEEGWLAHLLASFSCSETDVVAGQTYVAPTSLFAKAFALGWTYALRDDSGALLKPTKFYANNIMFRGDIFRRTRFRSVGKRSRGAATLLRQDLDKIGVSIWENRMARVDHPPPMGLRHMIVRALAHGRDHYMKYSEQRSLEGFYRSTGVAAKRLGIGFRRTFRDWRRVDLKRWQVPVVLTIISSYYGFFALGSLLTHINPNMMTRHFRV